MLLLVRILIRGYQLAIRPMMEWLSGPGGCCRFTPGCSCYFLQACEMHGVWRGSWLGLKRLGRCQPWGGQGFDPVPPATGAEAQNPKSETRKGLHVSKSR